MYYSKSLSNSLKKLASSLKYKKYREREYLFIAEGEKICAELLDSNYITEFLIIRQKSASERSLIIAEKYHSSGIPVYSASESQFDSVCDTMTPQDLLAVARIPEQKGNLEGNLIALEDVSDPGNIGTIIRSATWFGFHNLILNGNCADVFSPKVIRSAMGATFKCNFLVPHDFTSYIASLKGRFKLYGAVLLSPVKLKYLNPRKDYCLTFGSESHGISENVRKLLDTMFEIPGIGSMESLNVAIAAAIVMYELTK